MVSAVLSGQRTGAQRADNRIIHSMWYGTQLTRMELLTLCSFVDWGHEFHLWAYDDLSAYQLPQGVILRDAEEIIPRKRVFARRGADRETGVGRNSFGAPFSDLFRYRLLAEHGGIWVDMDVTCLRPFDFAGEYVFRPHRTGIVGSILKCPADSPLIKKVYRETARTVGPESDYLLPNRILTKHVQKLGLESYTVEHISNPDHWMEFVRPLIERTVEVPPDWYAIHWINEMWRTLKEDGGYYRGRKLLEYVPDKEEPRPHSTLWELYRKYGLVDPWSIPSSSPGPARKLASSISPIPVKTADAGRSTRTYLNMLLPSLVRGGAERSVIEIMKALQQRGGVEMRLFVLHRSRRAYQISSEANLKVIFADTPDDIGRSMRGFGNELLQSATPVVYTHLIPASALKHLWDLGILTIPVIQNMKPGWQDPVSVFGDPHVPFVVGVSDAVSGELRQARCLKPVITIRHELQRNFAAHDLARQRREIRNQYGVSDNTLLIGMVGQFKSQKAYTRAVRVLHRVQQDLPAKLMILGGWDHAYGGGRAAFEATCRRAVDLGVIADMIMPGDVHPTDPYFAAFDVFLSTSIYEGLSVALLEAIQSGCPIVTADAGGNREILPADGVLVKDGSDIEAYAQGILRLAHRTQRVLPPALPDKTLVPQLWTLLGKYGIASSVAHAIVPSGTLFVTENLNVGGPQASLVRLLSRLGPRGKMAACTFRGRPFGPYKDILDEAQVQLFSADGLAGVSDRAECVLSYADRLNVRDICFWNVSPELKLLLAKTLSARQTRLIDVSPGPMLFDELRQSEPFQSRIAFSARQYFDRLDAFVSKYGAGVPASSLGCNARKIHIIPNGIAPRPNFVALPPADLLLPKHLDRSLAIGTCCRIVPDKQIGLLLDVMAILAESSPGTSLTIVGGPDSESINYFNDLKARVRAEGLPNIFFVGECADVYPFLSQFSIFVMFSGRQGCPNAILEAMAMGLPIISNDSGGVRELVKDRVNGYVVSSPKQMAERVIQLQKNKTRRERMATASQAFAAKKFSLQTMAERYGRLLDLDDRIGRANGGWRR